MIEQQKPRSSRRAALARLRLPAKNQADEKDIPILVLDIDRGVHAGLWLDKYIVSLEHDNSGNAGDTIKSRQQLVKEVSQIPIPDSYRSFYRRWRDSLPQDVPPREAAVKGRMVIGLGDESVLETSVRLHHTYGVPYIPGSALKGLAASYAHLMAGEQWKQGTDAYTAVFGNTEEAGYVTFWDALYIPDSERKTPLQKLELNPKQPLHPDIITVHHREYYGNAKGAAPTDWDSPTPIPFLSATGVYLIALSAPNLAPVWLERVFEILEEALLVLGIGAKTSSGYGRMKIVDKPAQATSPEISTAEGYRREIEKVKDIPSQMYGYYQQWKRLETDEARKIVALAIVEKIAEAHREKWASSRDWYQDLFAFLKLSPS